MRRCWLFAVLVAGAANAADPAATAERIRRVEQRLAPPVLVRGESPTQPSLAERMAELKVPGVSIAVIHEGRVEWARGFGVKRVGGSPVTADTLFQAASISKPVFALAVLRLVDDGKLKLDANVNEYLKAWKVPENEFTRQAPVTLRRLLSHSAGLTVHGFPGYAANAPVPTTLQVLDGTPPANTGAIRVAIVPGTRQQYSGGGYVVAQQLLHDVTGIPLPKLMHDSVLAPLGMTHSTFEQPLPGARLAEIALPYAGATPVDGGPHTYPEMAPAGLWTTPGDLARFALGIQAALAGKPGGVLSVATARAMLTPVIGNQGIGPQVGGATARKFFMHGGANEGYRCLLVAYEDGEGAVVMTSSDSGDQLMGEVMRTIAHVYAWPDFAPPQRASISLKPQLLDRYVGAYQLNDGTPLVVRKVDDRLVSQLPGRTPLVLFPSSEREFFSKDIDVVVSFTVEADGAASAATHRIGGWERSGPRLDAERTRDLLADAERTAQRFKEGKPAPGSESATRQLLVGLASGKPDYARMTPPFADITRQQLVFLQQYIGGFGALKSLTFHRVNPEGGDEYDADFEKGALRIEVRLSADGRIEGAGFPPR